MSDLKLDLTVIRARAENVAAWLNEFWNPSAHHIISKDIPALCTEVKALRGANKKLNRENANVALCPHCGELLHKVRAENTRLREAVREWHTAMCRFNGTMGSPKATKAECDAAEERYHDAEEKLEEVFAKGFPLPETSE